MSRHTQSELDALLAAMLVTSSQSDVLLVSATEQPATGGKLLCEQMAKLIEEAHEIFHKAHKSGKQLPIHKVKAMHAEATKRAAHHWGKYSDASNIHSAAHHPDVVKARIEHGAEFHKYANIRDGLAQALKDRAGEKEAPAAPAKPKPEAPVQK